ncbi:MAG TPA: hypothetical protein PJ991_02835 [Kiritimatiellia bacterium]|nr:hypothetical protein [Kiritimatiellia bacterium]
MNNECGKKITTADHDIRGHSIWRILRQDMIFRVLPFGLFGGGPNLKFVAKMLFLHVFGKAGIWLYMRSGLFRHIVRKFHANKPR